LNTSLTTSFCADTGLLRLLRLLKAAEAATEGCRGCNYKAVIIILLSLSL
jgi:hypothetical protein